MTVQGVEITGAMRPGFETILTDAALSFVANLHRQYEPTRQALQAAAWGEPVPKTEADEKKLAAKGRKLLEEAKSGK